MRWYSSRRDAQGNAHTLAEDIRMSSLEALLPDDLEKNEQLHRARLTSYGVLREEIETYCECRGSRKCTKRETERFITPRRRRPNGHWCIWQRQGQTRQRQARLGQRQREARTARTGQGQEQGQEQLVRLNVGTVESADTTRKTVGARRTPTKVDSKGRHKPKNADAHNLDSKPSIVEPEVKIDEFSMTYLNVDARQQESEKMRGSRMDQDWSRHRCRKDGVASEYHVWDDDSW